MHCPRFIIDSEGVLQIEDEKLLSVKIIELFQEVFNSALSVKAKEYSVLIVEKVTLKHTVVDVLVTVLLKIFQVISVSVQPDLFLASLSSGISTGIILSVGERESQAICIAQGRPLLHTFRTSPVGVSNAILSFNHLLKDELEGLEILMKRMDTDGDGELSHEELQASIEATRPLFEKVACCNLKDKQCKDMTVLPSQDVANEPFTIESKYRHEPLQVIMTGDSSAEGCVDEWGGVVGLLFDCLMASNIDVRSIACKHIVICGGGAMIPGLPQAICDEATKAASQTSPLNRPLKQHLGLADVVARLPEGRFSVLPSPFLRSSLAWIGGSIFASIPSNYSRFVKLSQLISHTREGGTSGNGGFFYCAPDWQSLDSANWTFWSCAVREVERRGVEEEKNSGAKSRLSSPTKGITSMPGTPRNTPSLASSSQSPFGTPSRKGPARNARFTLSSKKGGVTISSKNTPQQLKRSLSKIHYTFDDSVKSKDENVGFGS